MHRKTLLCAVLACCLLEGPVDAAEKPRASSSKPAARKSRVPPLLEASAEQLEAARMVYLGHYECELNQSVDIALDEKHAGYVAVKHGRTSYVMKPVLSSTGALRLEDVKGATLMVQIASKSMLMDVKAGRRLVDDCISPRQRDLKDEAARAKAAESAASAASAASGPESAPPAASDPSAQPASAPASGASDSGPIAR